MKIEIKNDPHAEAGRLFADSADVAQELEFICEAFDPSGKLYDLYVGRITQSPIIHSRTTGKYYLMPWPHIIKMAVEAGIDKA